MSTVLLDSYDKKETTHGGFTTVSFSLSGDVHKAAIVNAVSDAYPRPDVDLDSLVGQKVTLLMGGENMMGAGAIVTEDATIFRGRGDQLGYMQKGKRTKGFVLNPAKVLDVALGYNQTAKLAAKVDEVRARFPQLDKLTQEHLAALPDDEHGDVCTLAVFGRWRMQDEVGTNEALWLIRAYDPEYDICEGVLFVPGGVGVSEYGSTYGRDLLRFGGMVVGFQPISYETAVEWTDRDHADVLAEVVAAAQVTA